MTSMSCAKCGAELIPGTNFCRSCGAPIESGLAASEMQTAVLDERVRRETQRFEARTTAEASDAKAVRTYRPASPAVPASEAPSCPAPRRRLIIVVVVLVLLLGGGGLIGVKRARQNTNKMLVSQHYTYPGSHTVLNIGDRDGAVLQMETTDGIDRVSEWYLSKFKPSKTIQVTPAAIIIKDEAVTVTMVASDTGTNIVIKQAAP